MNPTDRHGIIAACSWIVDRIKIIDEWPQQEHLAEIKATEQQGGGCAYNLGVDIRRLDDNIPVEAIGLIGNDADGSFLLTKITEAGINTKQLQQTDTACTSYTDVYTVASTGKRTFFHQPGAHDDVTPEIFDFSQCRGKILHLGLLGVHAKMDKPWQQDANGWVSVLKSARHYGIHTNLELVSVAQEKIREIALPCIPYLDSLIANEYELGALTNTTLCTQDNTIDAALFQQAADMLFRQSKNNNGSLKLIVAHSPQGALAMTQEGELHTRAAFAIDAQHIVSSVGAGDAFAAGILYGIHEGWQIDRSLELAHATAAISLRSATSVDAVEDVQQCLAFARSHQI